MRRINSLLVFYFKTELLFAKVDCYKPKFVKGNYKFGSQNQRMDT